MLKALRNKKIRKNIFIFLAIVIIPAFAFWGFGGALRSREESGYAGRIFGRRISATEFKDAMEAVKNQAIVQFGDNFSEIQKYLNLKAQAWDRLILLHEARRRKINIADKEVIEVIEKSPLFQRNGQFDNRIYSQMLQYVFRTRPRAFEEQTRQNIALSRLYKEATDGITLSDAKIKDEYRKANEEISIYYIASIPADFAKEIKPTEEEIKDYFAKNSFEFKEPVSFNIEYIWTDSEESIKKIYLALKKRRDFTKAAKEAGLEIKETGFFTQTGSIPGIGWSPQIMDLITKLKVGHISSPLLFDKRYFILKLKERKDSYIPEFAKVKDRVREALIKDKAKEMALTKIENCLKAFKNATPVKAGSTDFNKAAKEFGLKTDSTIPFKYGSYIEGIGASDNFWLVAKDLKENQYYNKVIKAPTGFYIIKLKDKTPLEEEKFASEKAEFTKKLLAQRKEEYFAQFLEELKRKAQ